MPKNFFNGPTRTDIKKKTKTSSFVPKRFSSVSSSKEQVSSTAASKPSYRSSAPSSSSFPKKDSTRTSSFPARNDTKKTFVTKNKEKASGDVRREAPRAPYIPNKSQDTSSKATSDTSWGTVASWYNDHLEKSGDTYHEKVIYPNLFRLLGDCSGKKILDLACGQGQFSRLLRDQKAYVTGVDLGKELIKIAESYNDSIKKNGNHKAVYIHGSADDLHMLKNESFDTVVCILALQNIENLQKTVEEVSRVLTKNGNFIFVLNHPSFRNPKQTHWGYDEHTDTQFRRVDEYMSESHNKIDMTPGAKSDKKFTVSFHRPLQMYVKALSKNSLAVTRLEEWTSHKQSERGPKQRAENKSRKEIPIFMCIEGMKLL